MKAIILSILVTIFTGSALAASQPNYFNKQENCIQTKDLKAVQSHFQQFKKITQGAGLELCRSQMSEQWFEIARSVMALKRIQVAAINRDAQDDLTRRAIEEKDWWAYFKSRANNFRVDSNCQPGVVAYVRWGGARDN